MKKNQIFLWMAAMTGALALVACVTINIYFPAEKVEAVAVDIVDDIRGNPPSETDDRSENQSGIARRIIDALSPASAWAEDETTVSNPTIRALKEKMKARFLLLTPFYQKKAITEEDDGYLSAAAADGLSLKEKRDLTALVDAENSDRKILYGEVAKALKIEPSQIDQIAKIFAKEWQKPLR